MMDIKFIRENKEIMKKVVSEKRIDVDVDKHLSLDEKRRNLIKKTEELRAEQNKLTKDDIDKGKEIKEEIKKISPDLKEVEEEYGAMMLLVPNVHSEDTPVGDDDNDNVEVSKWGEVPSFSFTPKNHIEIGKELDIIDFEKGVRTSGFRGYYLKNEAAFMSLALLWYCIEKMTEKGFTLMIPPTILREFTLLGSGHFPFGKEEVYQIANPGKLSDGSSVKEKLYLGGTSEPALLAYYADTLFQEKELPVKACAFSQCYRSEVGSYGKDTKGLYRVREFMKVEQVVFCKNDLEESNRWLEEMRGISEEILQDLKLPYRVIQVCTGDMGAGKHKMYDIETWMPSRDSYGETHSDSNLTDWQPRRLNIKYKNKEGERVFVHALNNTVIASPRILIAILENYQKEDGSIAVPDVLKKHLPFSEIKKKA